MRFDESFIKKTLHDVSIVYGSVPQDARFVVDSRMVQEGDIFVALPGKVYNGHAFIADALDRGAAGVLMQDGCEDFLKKIDSAFLKTRFVAMVRNTLDALIELAHAWRSLFTIPIIGITGSVGKTSTKELTAHIFDMHGICYLASQGNQNTQIGVALNILRLRSDHEIGIFEVGIGNRGEMAKIAALLRPTIAVITYIGHSHMEGLGPVHDIALEKRAIFSAFSERNIGIINGDQSILFNVSYPHPIVKCGTKMSNQIQARKVRIAGAHISFVLKIYGKKYPIIINKVHAGFVSNALSATAIAHLCGIPDEVIVRAIETPLVVVGRFQEKQLKENKGILIDDCYNANPESMKAALLAFQQIETHADKVAVLGDMLELGVNSPFWHRQLGRFLRKVPSLKRVILVGSMIEWTKKAAPLGIHVECVSSWQDAVNVLQDTLQQNTKSVVLVKASRSIGLDNLVKQFAA